MKQLDIRKAFDVIIIKNNPNFVRKCNDTVFLPKYLSPVKKNELGNMASYFHVFMFQQKIGYGSFMNGFKRFVLEKTKKVPQKISMWRHKNEGLFLSSLVTMLNFKVIACRFHCRLQAADARLSSSGISQLFSHSPRISVSLFL